MKYTLLKSKTTGERSVRNNTTGEKIRECEQPKEYARLRKLALKNSERASKDDLYRSCGLTKVIGSVSGSVYGE